jgi:hypothetical protein
MCLVMYENLLMGLILIIEMVIVMYLLVIPFLHSQMIQVVEII